MTNVSGAGAVVTGGGGGIGRAMARRLAADGARVVVNDLDPAAAQAVADEIGGLAVPGDTGTEAGIAGLIVAAEDFLGQVDIYCSNAGTAAGAGMDTPEDQWQRAWEVNTLAHVRAARLLLPGWLDRGSGHLICTVSAAGLLAMPGTASYSATKHAALSFAEWLSFTYRHRGLTVQAICPQGVRTGMLDGSDPAAEAILGDSVIQPEAVADAVIKAMADGRFMILPHPEVAAMYAGRAADPDQWLAGMNKVQRYVEDLLA
jgi:NAD(P)-dependent dehydrogenase (short-subunit alcohol dehydrogenase family)